MSTEPIEDLAEVARALVFGTGCGDETCVRLRGMQPARMCSTCSLLLRLADALKTSEARDARIRHEAALPGLRAYAALWKFVNRLDCSLATLSATEADWFYCDQPRDVWDALRAAGLDPTAVEDGGEDE